MGKLSHDRGIYNLGWGLAEARHGETRTSRGDAWENFLLTWEFII